MATSKEERDFWKDPVTRDELEELDKKIDDARKEHATRKAEARKATELMLAERAKYSSKFNALEEAKAKHALAQSATAAKRKVLEVCSGKAKSQQIATNTARRRLEHERRRVEDATAQFEEAKTLAAESEEYSQRQNTIALQAHRVAEKERYRLRRCKEVAHNNKMKAQHAATLVVPLEEPVSRLNMDFEPLDALALELEAHALRAREKLTEAAAYEHQLTLRLEDLVYNLPKLKQEQHKGYMHVEDKRRDLQDATERITMEEYQKAFFGRVYANPAPSPVDGTVAHHVGVQRQYAWEDAWGERGVGKYVVGIRLDEVVHELEKQAVLQCEADLRQIKQEHHDHHQVLNTLREENENVYKESVHARQEAAEVEEKLQQAQAAYDAAAAEAAEAEQASEDADRELQDQIGISEDAVRAADRQALERSEARMRADLELLKVENVEEVVIKAQKVLAAAAKVFADQSALMLALEQEQAEAEEEVQASEAAEAEVATLVEVREAECEWQQAKEQREEHKREQASSAERAAGKAMAEQVEHKRKLSAIQHFMEEVEERKEGVLGAEEKRRALFAMREEGERQHKQQWEAGRGTRAGEEEGQEVGWGLLDGRDDLRGAEAGVLQELLEEGQRKLREAARSEWELKQRLGDFGRVSDPARTRSNALLFARYARVFTVQDGGATLLRASPNSMPVGMKGWVSQYANEAGRKHSAVCGRLLEAGKHTWTVNVVDIRGKGMLFVGIIQYVRDEAGDMDARKRGVQESQLKDDRTVERLKMDLNNYCIGDDKQSWALASDGVKLHDGKAEEYAGVGFAAGDSITCSLDLDRQTLSFSLRGKELGQQLRGVTGPAWPAISLTRTLTAHIVLGDYWRS